MLGQWYTGGEEVELAAKDGSRQEVVGEGVEVDVGRGEEGAGGQGGGE